MKVFNFKVRDLFLRFLMVVFWIAVICGLLGLSRLGFIFSENSLTVLSWYGTLDREYVEKFEKETGVKVYLSYYTSNEELLVKLRATQGRGYDLIIPSDYAVKKLIQEGLLSKIDTSRLPFFSKLNPLLLGHSFDQNNTYTIPFEWELYTVGLNGKFIQPGSISRRDAWSLVFNPGAFDKNYRLTMVNDPVEAIGFAARYLFGNLRNLSPEEIQKTKQLLINQKKWIEAYTDVRPDYFLCTNNAAFAVGQSSAIWRAMLTCKNIDYVVPDETFISIENFAIPVGSQKTDLVYTFLDFLFSKDSYQHHFEQQRFCPARLDVIDELPATERQKEIMRSSPEEFSHYHFIKDVVSDQQKSNIWVAVKS